MKEVTVVCFLFSWTLLCCGINAEDSWNQEDEDSLGDLDDLLISLRNENLIKVANSPYIDQVYHDVPITESEDKDKCELGNTCDKITTNCVPFKNDNGVEDYYCACKPQYKKENDKSKDKCLDKDKCDLGNICDKTTTNCVPFKNDNGEEDYYCACKPQYKKENEKNKDKCLEKDKCDLGNTCDETSTKCVPFKTDNGEEDYYCTCKPQYKKEKEKSKDKCLEKDKCDLGNTCDETSTKCVPFTNDNGEEDYYCACKPQYKKENEKSKDKCLEQNNCDSNTCKTDSTKCVATKDSYYCDCLPGFQLKKGNEKETNKEECIQKDNCKTDSCHKESTKCFSKGDSYFCDCLPGFQLKPGNTKEANKDECQQKDNCADNTCPKESTTCVSKGESWYCKCDTGFKLKPGKKEASNKDECLKMNKCEADLTLCDKTADCNIIGDDDYRCVCKKGYKLGKNEKRDTNKEKCYRTCVMKPCKNGKCIDYKDKDEDASCDCTNTKYYGDDCETPNWCKNNKCNGQSCDYNLKAETGFCKCKKENQIFNYKTRLCGEKLPCMDKKCGTNEKCDNGNCACIEGYGKSKEADPCTKKTVCDDQMKSKCASNSICTPADSGYVRCSCDSTAFYYNNGICHDAECLLDKNKCCPSELKKDDTCKASPSCNKKCGKFGWCYKSGENEEECVCASGIAEVNSETGKCMLNAELCPERKLKADNETCDCTGKFKQADNKVTCERRMCADKDVQDECAKQKAVCDDDWGNSNGFQCKCLAGYTMENGVCVDLCSKMDNKIKHISEGKLCFLGKNGEIEYNCPIGFTGDNCGVSFTKDQSTFIISNLPIISEKYMKNSVLDINRLTTDVITSMEYTFQNLEFARLFKYKLSNNVILCTVWLQFKAEASEDIKRLQYQKIDLTNKQDAALLPPELLLQKSSIGNVKENKAELCSEGDPFCDGTKCENNKCSCPEGSRVIDYSVRKLGSGVYIFKCEDINECTEGTHSCPSDSTECVNTDRSYYCKCKDGYKVNKGKKETENKEACIGICNDPNPCNPGTCKIHEKTKAPDCSCPAGKGGSFCDRDDVNFAGASKKTVVVGAVLGSILAIIIIAVVVFVIRQRKNSYSEDFTPCPRPTDAAEMTERRGARPMRGGMSNPAYQ